MSFIRELALTKATGGGGGGGEYEEMFVKLIDRTLEDIVIPDGVTTIGRNAFFGCLFAKSVTIPDSVEFIADGAFGGVGATNGGVKLSVIANGVKTIESTGINGAFGGNINMNKLILPSIVSIGADTFGGCVSLTYIYLGPNCTLIESGAFGGVPITCKVECGFAEGAVSGFPNNAGFAGNPALLDIKYNVAEPTQ